MRFSGHSHHHRYHQHQQDAYGPSRIQDYFQPSQAFYGYNQSYQQQFAYNSSQNCTNSYNLPHRAPIPSEFPHTAAPGYTHMQNRLGTFRVGFVENQQHSNLGWGFTVADKINPLAASATAAVAAPSQLTQIAGSIEVVQRATNSSIGQSLYLGPGGRGDISVRRALWGQFNHSGPPLYHGRGRGRGGSGGRQIPPHSSRPTNSLVASAPVAAGATSVVQSAPSVPQQKPLAAPATVGAIHSSRPTNSQVASAPVIAGATSVVQCAPSVPGQKPLPTLAQVPSAPLQLPKWNTWCEICKVHCGCPAKLEEHKNGKWHKKELRAQGKLKILKATDVQQSEQMPASQLNSTVHPEKIQELEKEGCLTENIISEANDNQQGEIELQKETGKNLEVPAEEPEGEPGDNSIAWNLGSELEIGGRGGKYMKSDDGSRRPVEFPQPTQAPFICELCNVKCDSESLVSNHMSGKRHKKNLKRASRGLQALYPPDANAVANLIDFFVERGISNPQILSAQLVIRSVLSETQKPGISSPSGPLLTRIQVSTSVDGSGFEPVSTCLAGTSVRGHGTCKT